MKITEIVDNILDLLFPPKCIFCGKLLERMDNGVCAECMKRLPFIAETDTFPGLKGIERTASCLYYEGAVRDSLLRYKFHGKETYAPTYGQFMSKCIDENGISCDIITWAPLSRARKRRRGYDQAGLVAWETAKRLDVRCEKLLSKTRNNTAQSTISDAKARAANVRGVYTAVDPERVRGRRILIVDDILTTGATLTECAGVLKNAGAAAVYAACVARGRG